MTPTATHLSEQLNPLRARIAGRVIAPCDDAYEQDRQVWNGAIDKRPTAIVRCASGDDVRPALRAARDHELEVAVRGGGHSVAGHGTTDGGLLIDLSPMREVCVDPGRRVATVQAGALWSDLDGACQEHGLATTGGVVSHTGVAGLTLGGGIGWLMRRHGLTIDNLLSVDLTTVDGERLQASAEQNADLFWGLRGAGANLGVATSFRFALHPLGPQTVCGLALYPLAQARTVLRSYRAWIDGAPDELGTLVSLRTAPPLPAVPERWHGEPVVGVAVCYAGPAGSEAERTVAGARELGEDAPIADTIGPKPYMALQQMLDPGVPHGRCYYWKNRSLPALRDEIIDVCVDNMRRMTSPRTLVPIFHLGGAVSATADEASAYCGRDAAHEININAAWEPGDPDPQRHIDWARSFWAELEPFSHTSYVNFLGADAGEEVKAAYGAQKYARLTELKRRYDPDNVLRLNQNIAG